MNSLNADGSAVVIGASGGIGAALVDALRPHFAHTYALARSFTGDAHIDITDEASIERAATHITLPPRLVIVATGVLRTPPEKTYRALTADALMDSFRLNAIGPALVAKHFLPLLAPHGKAVFAALSARVGSITDNRSGGWHAYRTSKAALNMLLRNLAIETTRRRPDTLCIGLHPGTVDTHLSTPFQRNVPNLLTPPQSATHLLTTIDTLTPADSGHTYAWDGTRLPP